MLGELHLAQWAKSYIGIWPPVTSHIRTISSDKYYQYFISIFYKSFAANPITLGGFVNFFFNFLLLSWPQRLSGCIIHRIRGLEETKSRSRSTPKTDPKQPIIHTSTTDRSFQSDHNLYNDHCQGREWISSATIPRFSCPLQRQYGRK